MLSGVYVPQQVLAVTFTARAAGEMRTRLRDLGVGGVQARTFHAAALRQLGYFWPRTIGGAPPSLLEHKASLVADAAARLRISVDRPAIRDLAAEVEWAKVNLLTAAAYPAAATKAGRDSPGGFELPVVARLIEAYEEAKTDRGVIDFEDVLLITGGILEEHPDVAAAVRAQYRHCVVDEYQDVNALQQRLLDAWLGDRDDLCVVGDPNQTIYSFTGATPEHLLGFRRRFPDAALVRLVRDYRSSPQVVALANALSDGGAHGRDGVRLLAQGPPGPVPVLREYADDEDEAAGVARHAARLVAMGVPAAEIAVLYRTNAQSQALEQAMSRGRPALPGARRGAVLLTQGGARRRPAAARSRPGRRRRPGRRDLGLPTQARDVLASAGWTEQPPPGGGRRARALGVAAGTGGAGGHSGRAEPASAGLAELVTELEERAAAQHAPTVQGVTLASLHAAKGLEWDAVFLVGLSDGLMPISLAEGWEAIAEERRLLYVGVTRARTHLVLSWARARNPGRTGGSVCVPVPATVPGRRRHWTALPPGSPVTAGRSGRRRSGKTSSRAALPTTCSGCGVPLENAAQRKVGRCTDCPPDTTSRCSRRCAPGAARPPRPPGAGLRRLHRCDADRHGARFTDATLAAMAQRLPCEVAAGLARIAGVGPAKAGPRYGADVLAGVTL